MNDYMFGNFLYQLRTEKGLSQSQLGEMLGVTNKAVSKWENGTAKPSTKLLPQMAIILGVSVEEIFACKRIETKTELEQMKQYLFKQKRKFAVLSSVFCALVTALPLLLIEFICVVAGFSLPDDVIGPLGSALFILLFVISFTAFIIFRTNCKCLMIPQNVVGDASFEKRIKRGYFTTLLIFLTMMVLFSIVWYILRYLCSFALVLYVFGAVAAFTLIFVLGVIVYHASIIHLLKINVNISENRRKHIQFSNMPIWCKVCYLGAIILFPISLTIGKGMLIGAGWLVTKIVVIILWSICAGVVIIYSMKK
jgi:transcriptional regulator with XRE-family HTH domain